VSYILLANETERELTPREITANCALLLDAGSETTATMLSGKDVWSKTFANETSRLPVLSSEEYKLYAEIDRASSQFV